MPILLVGEALVDVSNFCKSYILYYIVFIARTIYSQTLLYTGVNILLNRQCSMILQNIVRTHICANVENQNLSIFSDVGSALVLISQNSTLPVQIGIMSYAPSDQNGLPGVSTRITKYLLWIKYETGIEYRTKMQRISHI